MSFWIGNKLYFSSMLGDKEQIEKAFGQVIKELRKSQNLSQAMLAELGDFQRTFISDLERGVYQPTLYSIFRLGGALGISPHEILKRVEEKIRD
ncbi:helix-turn-helix domain-containing protein [Balneola sp. EhC07]|uniref:helix-turn-helix domain-containing protein n=1 Tax=Balneola sp. EhC07 TaxID=1849360 RepID=UPI0019112AC1|nr:helix-turn-helix transcriptional regulator [Balneola sp. EhC07]